MIRIRSDITELAAQQIANLTISGSIFVAVVIALTMVLTLFLHNAIIGPVREIGSVCTTVTGGDFDTRVDVKSRDEIGVLGQTVNEMIQGLYERFQLSKFVSTSTLRSIGTEDDGARVELTLLFSDVRSFTAYSEAHPPELVIEVLNRLLNFQTEAILQCGGDVDKYVGDEVLAVFSGPRQAERACRAALQIQREIFGRADDRYGGLDVGIGINTGEVILGMIGSERRAKLSRLGAR